MNRDRRKRIADLVEKLSGIMIELDEAIETANDEKLSGIMIELDEAIETANDIASEEREAFDSLPENLQGGEKGEAMSSCADDLEGIETSIEDAKSGVSEAIETLGSIE